MDIAGTRALVTGAASGLGRATAQRLVAGGARVTLLDLPASAGATVATELGVNARFTAGDVTSADDVQAAIDAGAQDGPLRILVHCAGRGGPLRIVDRDGSAGSLETFAGIVTTNLIGTFNVLRLAAAAMACGPVVDDERGVCVLTASIAGYEGQIGQVPYASSKAGVIGLTLVAARDLASRQIRVCTIAPGVFATPMLDRLSTDARAALGAAVPHPRRLGYPEEFADLANHLIANPMINGETIRIDGSLRMPPR